jgi:hypothetical protein
MGRKFKHPQLERWVADYRGELIAALLTLVRAWYAQGKPLADTPVLGGFEDWCKIVGGVLANAGIKGFLANLKELYDVADDGAAEWERFLRALDDQYDRKSFTTATLVQDLIAESAEHPLVGALPEDLAELFHDPAKRSSLNRRLGKAFSGRVQRRFGPSQHRIERAGENRSAQMWKVVHDPST